MLAYYVALLDGLQEIILVAIAVNASQCFTKTHVRYNVHGKKLNSLSNIKDLGILQIRDPLFVYLAKPLCKAFVNYFFDIVDFFYGILGNRQHRS